MRPALPDAARPPPIGADRGTGRGWTGFRRRIRPGYALPAPGRTRPAPAVALRRPESLDNLHTEGTTAVPGRIRGARRAGNPAFWPFPPIGLRPRCGNGRCCTSEWKWGFHKQQFRSG